MLGVVVVQLLVSLRLPSERLSRAQIMHASTDCWQHGSAIACRSCDAKSLPSFRLRLPVSTADSGALVDMSFDLTPEQNTCSDCGNSACQVMFQPIIGPFVVLSGAAASLCVSFFTLELLPSQR